MRRPANVLVISYSFPPQGEVGGVRVSQFCRYLPQNGMSPIVLTCSKEFYESIDESIPVPDGVEVVRAGMHPTPLTLYRRLAEIRRNLLRERSSQPGKEESVGASASTSGAESRLKLHLETFLQTPDRYWGWYLKAMRAAHQIMTSRKIDVIFSSGPPFICHLVARKLHRKYDTPWIADFRDPWASNEIATKLPKWRQTLDRRWENSCVRESSMVVCNTDRLRLRFQQHYADLPENKFVTLTNGFIDLPFAESANDQKGSVWLHTGELYSSRRIDTFCTAVEQLAQEGRISIDNFHLDFYGGIEPKLYLAAKQATPSLFEHGVLRFKSRVPWAESQKLLRRARLLLLFQGTFHSQTPAKAYEYLATGAPIFAVAKKGSLTDLIEATDSGLWADPEDVDDIKSKLMQCLALPVRKPEDVFSRLPQLHYSFLTAKLAEWMRELTDNPSKRPGDTMRVSSAQLL